MCNRITLGVSACLLGKPVRYDGGARLDAYLKNTWGRLVDFVPLCPEVESGLPIPREPMKLTATQMGIRVIGQETGIDHTDRIALWCQKKVSELEEANLMGIILKGKSPSCHSDTTTGGDMANGIFHDLFRARNPLIPIASDAEIQDKDRRDLFVSRIFILKRWREAKNPKPTRAALIAFHTANKLLLLAHSPAHYRTLGRIVADPARIDEAARLSTYEIELLALLEKSATPGRHVNVLHHIAGYFRKKIDHSDRRELEAAIDDFRSDKTSLATPIALANHHSRKHPNNFLQAQTYLHPEPLEIKLRG